ncbi:hypothetical protein FSARC_1999 [Fusarium sarcochroum]|uniref:JmjC domain-containing protein n=1 Tax=Fusarium sarcochroum TaxID=1208366 RepID=A0A8H4U7W2_9HYPO|nr:hypothetical protein FSARC_1999 [Fusarium sarcochroum]
MNKWFEKQPLYDSMTLSAHISQFHDAWFPYEILASSPRQKQSTAMFRRFLASEEPEDEAITRSWDACFADPIGSQGFFQFHAPLRLLIKALAFNQVQSQEGQEPLELYIAQSSLTDLPPALQEDVPTPELVQRVGKGDVYNSSVWLGTEPTYTPLHRDPNPNIFCQLCSNKVIRLMAPRVGDILFSQVQRRIQKQSNSRIRTEEMMQGDEREALYDAVWGAGPLPTGTYEADLGPGDALFIPNGWWHSVKSKGTNGHLNGSVNWWFR